MRQAAPLLSFLVAAVLACSAASAADNVPGRLDAARQAYQRGDIARTAQEIEAALAELHDRLGKALAEFLPPAPAGWQAETPETQALALVGGGLSVTRAYTRNEATLNAALILDSPAVAAAAALFTNSAATAGQANLKHLKVGNDDALLRWDPANKSGEITMVLGNRVLLQIEGDNLASSDLLVDVAKGWNVPGIRKVAGGS
jgi:hypothetical protein